jgi:hypothetical protein
MVAGATIVLLGRFAHYLNRRAELRPERGAKSAGFGNNERIASSYERY